MIESYWLKIKGNKFPCEVSSGALPRVGDTIQYNETGSGDDPVEMTVTKVVRKLGLEFGKEVEIEYEVYAE